MKKIIILSSILLNILFVHAQDDNSTLWRITGDGIEKPSYIFGTIHLICPDDFYLSDELKAAFDSCEQAIFEIDMDDFALMTKMQKLMLMPGAETVHDYLTDTDYDILDKYLKENMGMGLQMMGKFKPFALMSMMLMNMTPCQPLTYETELMKLNKNQPKEILGLETPEFQIGIFDSIPYKYQFDMLIEMIEQKDEVKEMFDTMIDLYKKQDLEKLLEFIFKSEWNYEDFNDLLINKRNISWIPVIEGYVSSKPSFIAVGAGHLPGNSGVLNLLKEKGYKVEAIKQGTQ